MTAIPDPRGSVPQSSEESKAHVFLHPLSKLEYAEDVLL